MAGKRKRRPAVPAPGRLRGRPWLRFLAQWVPDRVSSSDSRSVSAERSFSRQIQSFCPTLVTIPLAMDSLAEFQSNSVQVTGQPA